MKKFTCFLLLLSLVLNFSLFPAFGLAQSEKDLRISSMEISIWPEYDEPKVLVMNHGKMADKSMVPAKVRFLVPKGAEVHSTCAITETGEHQQQAREIQEKGEFDEVSYNLPLPEFHFEFYYNPLQEGANKSFDYLIRPTYPIDMLQVDVQQPLKATNFKVSPSGFSERSDDKGFKYYVYSFNNVLPDKDIKLSVAYTKTDPNPSVEKQEAQAGQTPQTGGTNPWIILLTIAGSVLLALGGYWLVTSRQSTSVAYSGMRAPQPGKRGKKPAVRFCPNCGTAVKYADNFCPNCGKRVRK